MVLRLWHALYNETTTRRTEPSVQMCKTDDHENKSAAAIDGMDRDALAGTMLLVYNECGCAGAE